MAENQPEFVSVKNKIKDFGFRSGSFTPQGENDAISYVQVVLTYEIDGEEEEVVLSGQNPTKPKVLRQMLRGADKQVKQGSMLDDEN